MGVLGVNGEEFGASETGPQLNQRSMMEWPGKIGKGIISHALT